MDAGLGFCAYVNLHPKPTIRQSFEWFAGYPFSRKRRHGSTIQKIRMNFRVNRRAALGPGRKHRAKIWTASDCQLVLPVDQLVIFDDSEEVGEAAWIYC